MHRCCRLILLLWALAPAARADPQWTTYEDCGFVKAKYHDGDSFHVKAPTGHTYIFRLYGVDCPETDKRHPQRIAQQARDFRIPPDRVTHWGKKARDFTARFLRRPFTVHTLKEKARGESSRNRYYAIVINDRGERLDEALVTAGLARAHGQGAEWPRRMTRKRFLGRLHALESAAKRDKAGIWARP